MTSPMKSALKNVWLLGLALSLIGSSFAGWRVSASSASWPQLARWPQPALTESQMRNPVRGATAGSNRSVVAPPGTQIEVTSLEDNTTADDQITLREAIQMANAGAMEYTIVFAPSLTASGPATINLSLFDPGTTDGRVGPTALIISSTITIRGPVGNNGITLNRSGANFRLFHVTATGNLTLEFLTLTNGRAIGFNGGNAGHRDAAGGGGAAGLGGALFVSGVATIRNSTVAGNTAQGGSGGNRTSFAPPVGIGGSGGGGLGEVGGTATETNTSGAAGGGPNGAPAGGGGASGGFGGGGGGSNRGAGASGPGGFGGGGGAGSFGVLGSAGGFGGGGGGTGRGNVPTSAGGFGGGNGGGSASNLGGMGGGGAGMGGAIFLHGGTLNIVNSTLTNNSAPLGTTPFAVAGSTNGQGLGGAIFNLNGTVLLQNSTISGNTASTDGRNVYSLGDGSGMTVTGTATTTASVTAQNTIIGQAGATSITDFVATTNAGGTSSATGGGNLICSNMGFTGTIVSTADPLLPSLANNGGPTQTLALAASSPARDVGDDSLVGNLTTDQRGGSFARIVGVHVDIGAFEFVPPPNAAPSITAQAGVSRSAGNPAANSQIATVSDTDQPSDQALTVQVSSDGTNFSSSATKNGVTVSNLNVAATGNGPANVTADVVATCTATNASFTLQVTDSASATATATLNVAVTAPAPPMLSASGQSFASSGGTGGLTINLPSGCAWTATNNATSFVTLTSPASGAGNGTLSFSVAANNNSTPRSGTLVINGVGFNITQGASFGDAAGHPFAEFIGKLSARGITQGCGGGNFCPDDYVTRQQMAVLILRAREGAAYMPPSATGTVFADVPADMLFAGFMEELRTRGITAGCATNPLRYCPSDTVTRQQMAVFVLRAVEGGGYMPPAATGTVFADVPANMLFAAFMEEFARRGITSGCAANPAQYCPTLPVTRAAMAVFLVRAFNL